MSTRSRVSGIHLVPRRGPIWPRVVAFFAGAAGVIAASWALGGRGFRPTHGDESVLVAGQLTRNDCGVGLGVPDVWTNPGRISTSDGVVRWEPADGSVPLSGTLDDHASATMRSTLIVQMKSDLASSACVMRRDDRLDLVLAATSPRASVVGDLTYTFSSVTDSSCSSELATRGGAYDRLPCEIHYALSTKP